MRRLAALLAIGLSGAAHAQGPKPEDPSQAAMDGWLRRETAELVVLDKVNAKSSGLTLKVGQAADNASLSISLRGCVVRPPDMPKDAAAFLDIKDSRPGAPGFHGWILVNEPAVSVFQHPIYDVRLLACR